MDKSGAKFKFIGHSTEIIRQSKNKGTLYSESLRFERPGFDSRRGQTLRAYSFAALWPT